MYGILVISHEPLGTALIRCARHVHGGLAPQLAALDIVPDEDPATAGEVACELLKRINDGSGALVLTDCFGATPSRIASRLSAKQKVEVLAGVNLPMLLKAISLRREGLPLEDMVDRLQESARAGILRVEPVQMTEVCEGKSGT
jgi:mannose PTS system EIIA component